VSQASKKWPDLDAVETRVGLQPVHFVRILVQMTSNEPRLFVISLSLEWISPSIHSAKQVYSGRGNQDLAIGARTAQVL
jgi:hypothetical protein